MSILEGIKASNYKPERPRFVIKPRPSSKDAREEAPVEQSNATDSEVIQFIEYMIAKSARLKELVEKRTIYNEQGFYQKHLFNSICLKTILKQILDKMMSERRLGKNLKGMNKSNLVEIQNIIWTIVERQASLYHNDLDYTRQKQQLSSDLRRRKEELVKKLQQLGTVDRQNEENVMLTEQCESEL